MTGEEARWAGLGNDELPCSVCLQPQWGCICIKKPGTIIRLPDGRIATTVYNGLDGVGIKWGRHSVTLADLNPSTGIGGKAPADYPWFPDAMLRDPYPGADLPCVGEDYEIVATQEDKNG